MSKYKVPVLLLTYRKAEFLSEIFEMIEKYAPSKLYVSINNFKGINDFFDVKKVKKIIKGTSFPFEVELIPYEKHQRINDVFQKTIDYVFSIEKSLIILEDDIIPSLSFFHFCESMLLKHQSNKEIGCINGCNLNAVNQKDISFLSGISFPYWGWATWKEKWDNYREDNFYWNNRKNEILNQISEPHREFFTNCFDANSVNFNVWDMQWNLSLMAQGQKTIFPGENLTTNKGFLKKATTTKHKSTIFGNLPMKEISSHEHVVKNDKMIVAQYEKRVIQLVEEMNRVYKKYEI